MAVEFRRRFIFDGAVPLWYGGDSRNAVVWLRKCADDIVLPVRSPNSSRKSSKQTFTRLSWRLVYAPSPSGGSGENGGGEVRNDVGSKMPALRGGEDAAVADWADGPKNAL